MCAGALWARTRATNVREVFAPPEAASATSPPRCAESSISREEQPVHRTDLAAGLRSAVPRGYWSQGCRYGYISATLLSHCVGVIVALVLAHRYRYTESGW